MWVDNKFQLGLDFPNLPYFEHGDLKLTESKAIMHYICKKWNPRLLGVTAEEVAICEMVSNVHETITSELL